MTGNIRGVLASIWGPETQIKGGNMRSLAIGIDMPIFVLF